MGEHPPIAMKAWKTQKRREIKKAPKQAGTRNARSMGELPGKAVGQGEVGDVVEDAEYAEAAEDDGGVEARDCKRS